MSVIEEKRQTGRTNRMIAAARKAATEGRIVYILADNMQDANRIKLMVHDIPQIQVGTPNTLDMFGRLDWNNMRVIGYPNKILMVDHHTIEDRYGKLLEMWQRWDNPATGISVSVGDRVWFEGERMPYTVKACDHRYLICTKPFAAKKTVIYSIVDLCQRIRGTENLVFCMGFETDEQCQDALKRLQNKESEISHKSQILLNIVKFEKKR